MLKEEVLSLLTEDNAENPSDYSAELLSPPYVIMVVGVNGVGKTTTIGKLATNLKSGKSVYLGAADIHEQRLSNSWLLGRAWACL